MKHLRGGANLDDVVYASPETQWSPSTREIVVYTAAYNWNFGTSDTKLSYLASLVKKFQDWLVARGYTLAPGPRSQLEPSLWGLSKIDSKTSDALMISQMQFILDLQGYLVIVLSDLQIFNDGEKRYLQEFISQLHTYILSIQNQFLST